jgi:transposase
MEEYVVGLDVHKGCTTFVVENAAGAIVRRGAFPTTAEGITAWLRGQALPAGTRVGLETGTLAFFVSDALARAELTPIVVDAHEVRLKAHRPRQKSDRRDAFEVCDGVRRDQYRSRVYVPSPALRLVRELLARRRHFVRIQTAQCNAAKKALRGRGQAALARSLRTATGWSRVETAVAGDAELTAAVAAHQRVWAAAHTERLALEATLAVHAHPLAADMARLQTVPGVGPLVALTAIAALADVTRFPSAKQVASYAGLVPSTHQSGTCDRHGHITKCGSAELRAMLVEAAHHAAHRAHPLHGVFTKLCVRRGYKPAIVAIAHRLCRILFALLRDQSEFRPGLTPPAPRSTPPSPQETVMA